MDHQNQLELHSIISQILIDNTNDQTFSKHKKTESTFKNIKIFNKNSQLELNQRNIY